MAGKGRPKTGGRQPGVRNKVSQNLREDIMEVHQKLGGVAGMLEWAAESDVNRRIFYSQILPKVLPKEIKAEVDQKISQHLELDKDTIKRMAAEFLKGE